MRLIKHCIVSACLMVGIFSIQAACLAATQPLKTWKIAFVRGNNIWTANGDGSGQKLIVKNASSPEWSPDKRRIAFAKANNVWVANADGSGQRLLTHKWSTKPYSGSVTDISWNRTTNWLAFSHGELFRIAHAGSKEATEVWGSTLYRVPVDAKRGETESVFLDVFSGEGAFNFLDQSHPAWSRSGDVLAFTRNGDIWIAERESEPGMIPGWDINRLAAVAIYDAATYRASLWTKAAEHLSWSPDSSSLAYGICRQGGTGFWELHLLELSESYGVRRDIMIDDYSFYPSYSPDGSFIAYCKMVPDGPNIWVTTTDGKHKSKLISNASQPAW